MGELIEGLIRLLIESIPIIGTMTEGDEEDDNL